jgi:hypothetical protein
MVDSTAELPWHITAIVELIGALSGSPVASVIWSLPVHPPAASTTVDVKTVVAKMNDAVGVVLVALSRFAEGVQL